MKKVEWPAIGMRRMQDRPRPGQRIIVQTKDGQQLECSATLVVVADRRGIIIYHGRKSIDEDNARGWWSRND